MRPFKSLLILFLLLPSILKAQDVEKKQPIEIDYNSPKTYIIGGIKVDGIKYLNANQIISVTGLREGDSVTIPSEALSSTLKRIWLQKAFSSVGLYVDSLSAAKDTAFLRLELVERPRVIRWDFQGVKSGE